MPLAHKQERLASKSPIDEHSAARAQKMQSRVVVSNAENARAQIILLVLTSPLILIRWSMLR